jgi:electron transport complex protein RnfA
LEALFFGAGAALGFGLVLALLGGIRERLEEADIPRPFKGVPITLITAGIMSLAFYGFNGLGRL